MNGHDGGAGEDEVCTDFCYRLQWRVGRDREREGERERERARERERERAECTLVEELRKNQEGRSAFVINRKKSMLAVTAGLIPVSARGLRLREPRQAHYGVCLY